MQNLAHIGVAMYCRSTAYYGIRHTDTFLLSLTDIPGSLTIEHTGSLDGVLPLVTAVGGDVELRFTGGYVARHVGRMDALSGLESVGGSILLRDTPYWESDGAGRAFPSAVFVGDSCP